LSAGSIPRMRASPRHAPTLASCFAPRLAPTATRSAPFLSCTEEEAEPTPPPTPATVRTPRSDALDATSSSTSPSTPTALRLCWCAPRTATIGMCSYHKPAWVVLSLEPFGTIEQLLRVVGLEAYAEAIVLRWAEFVNYGTVVSLYMMYTSSKLRTCYCNRVCAVCVVLYRPGASRRGATSARSAVSAQSMRRERVSWSRDPERPPHRLTDTTHSRTHSGVGVGS
jgi:hypothetical protein